MHIIITSNIYLIIYTICRFNELFLLLYYRKLMLSIKRFDIIIDCSFIYNHNFFYLTIFIFILSPNELKIKVL